MIFPRLVVTKMPVKRLLLCMACVLPMAAIPLSGAQTPSSSKCSERCLTLHGRKDADHGLGFSVAYTTTAKTEDCVSHNRMAGVTTAQTRVEFMPPVRKGETYRIEIPLSQHTGGKCGWKLAGVSVDVVSVASRREPPKAGYSLFGFGDTPGTIERLDLKCRRTAYKRAFGEQAAYLCLTAGQAQYPALGGGSHVIELNFGERQ